MHIVRTPAWFVALSCALLSVVVPASAFAQSTVPLVRVDVVAGVQIISYVTVMNGVVTPSPNTGGGATGGPTGADATTAFADAFQTGQLGMPLGPARSDTHADVNLSTGRIRGTILGSVYTNFGPNGTADGQLADRLTFTNSGSTPIVLPYVLTVEGDLTINPAAESNTNTGTVQFGTVAGFAAPVQQGSNLNSHSLTFYNQNRARTFASQLSGQVFTFGTGPIWTISPVGAFGARMESALIVPPGVSAVTVLTRLSLDCRFGSSCDYQTGNRGASFNFGTFPAGLSMSSLSGVFLGITPTPTVPGAPTAFQATASGNAITMSWGAPATGSAPTGYSLLARTSPTGPVLVTLPLGNVTSFAVNAPNGTFWLSVVASNAVGTGVESAQASVTTPAPIVPPGAPTALAVSVAGDAATFTWAAPTSGGPPTGYTLLAGLTPAFAVPIASMPLPPSPGSVTVGGIPAGTYYVRLRAQNAGGAGPASNEVTVAVAGPAAPTAPTLNPPSVAGSTVGLSWTAGAGGGAPTSYVLIARTAGGALIGTVPLTGTSLTVPGVPAGTYRLTLTARNAVGSSPESAPVTLVVP